MLSDLAIGERVEVSPGGPTQKAAFRAAFFIILPKNRTQI